MFCMPLLKIETTVNIPEEKQKPLLAALSKVVASTIGKPEQYVMVSISHSAMLMSAKAGNAAFVDVRSIGGLSAEVNRKLSREISKLLGETLGISADRVYLNFTGLDAGNWGWNGSTFG